MNSEMLRIRDWSLADIAGNSKYITKLRKPLLRFILLTLEIIPYVEASEAMFRSVLEILSRHANAL